MSWGSKSDDENAFVTNFDPYEIDGERMLRIARGLNIPAWIDKPIDGMYGTIGFYVHPLVTDLCQFWEIVNEQS